MKKISLLSIVILSMLFTSCNSNPPFNSLSEALKSIEENASYTIDLMKEYQNDKGLFINDELDVEYISLDKKVEAKSNSSMNINRNEYEAKYDIDLSSEDKKVECYVINEDVYVNISEEEKYRYNLLQNKDNEEGINDIKELLFESGIIDITLLWLSNDLTSDNYLLELDKIALKYYKISFLALLGKNDRILLSKTLDAIKENINLYLLYEGNSSSVTLSIDKEKYDQAIDNIQNNIDTSISTIKSKPLTYGSNIKNVYDKLSSILEEYDLKQLEDLSLTINSKKKIINKISLSISYSSFISIDLDYQFCFYNKYVSLSFPTDLNSYISK